MSKFKTSYNNRIPFLCIVGDGFDDACDISRSRSGTFHQGESSRLLCISHFIVYLFWQSIFIELSLKTPTPCDTSTSVALAAVEASLKSKAAAIIVLTTTGRSAHLISKYRPRCPIIAITRCAKTARQAHLYRGILPFVVDQVKNEDWPKDVDNRIQAGINLGKQLSMITTGDTVIVVTGWKQGSGSTNTIRLVTV